jgi:O-antigen/teichoic acid export membrane protein
MTPSKVSRTIRLIQNARVALFFYVINLGLQFFSRKVFLDYIGAELLGLNTTAQNLLQFLNLAESGIGAAVAFALYKPLSVGDRQEINNIVSIQGWFYRWVALFVIIGSLVLMAWFPYIFAKAQIPLIYAYGTFIAFLLSALLSYFVNYKMIVLSADQKEYKIISETQSVKIIKVTTQILLISNLSNGYLWWMVLEVLAAILTSYRLNHCIKQEYPWLNPDVAKGKQIKEQYSYILIKTRQLFFHKIGAYVSWQATPLIIYFFTSLSTVAVYGNYVILFAGGFLFMDAIFKGLNAGVGSLVAEGNKSQIKKIFWQAVTMRLCIAGLLCCGVTTLSESFVELWIGKQFVMSLLPLSVMAVISFFQMTRSFDAFLSAYGLFQDTWAPLCESILNIFLSILLGCFFGLTGILIGVLISQLLVVNSWKPYFLYLRGFREPILEYVIKYTQKLFLVFVSSVSTYYVFINYFSADSVNFFYWTIDAIQFVLFYVTICGILFVIFDKDFRFMLNDCCKTLTFFHQKNKNSR